MTFIDPWGRLRPPLCLVCLAAALLCAVPPCAAQTPVRNGLDALVDDDFAELRALAPGREPRLALVSNDAARALDGRRAVDVLAHARGLRLLRLFAPEHGPAARLDTEKIGDARDVATGLPVFSVYGANEAARRPRPELLRSLDAVVFDLPDAGLRWFTYETTLGYFLEACAEAGVPLVVLDRPNPLGGLSFGGLVSTRDKKSFVNYFPMPELHGMTLGELAVMFNAHAGPQGGPIGARLVVVRLRGWRRSMLFADLGQPWTPPTPNLRSPAALGLYPIVSVFEGSELSVGRGSDEPFQLVGAPWLDADRLLAALRRNPPPGLVFERADFTPREGKFKGELCRGLRLRLRDARAYYSEPQAACRASLAGLRLARELLALGGGKMHAEKMSALLANDASLADFLDARRPLPPLAPCESALGDFAALRRAALLY